MLHGFHLDAADLDRLYPCHLVLDADTRVIAAGRVIQRLLPELSGKPLFKDAFLVERPQGVTDFEAFSRARDQTFLLVARSRSAVRLKGEFFPVAGVGAAVFFTVLWFSDAGTLDDLGLAMNDFAISDASSDFVFLVETQAALLRDAQVLTERLKVARDEAVAASRLKSEFLGNMSHELRTPLNAIIGFSDYLLSVGAKTAPPKHIEYLKDIRSSGLFLLDIINDLLDLARIEQGKLVLEETNVDLGIVAREAVKSVSEMARERSIAIRLTGFTHPVAVRADRRVMQQVLLNLLSNAVKFNKDGGAVEVSASVTPQGDLTIGVADTGIGVDPAVIPQLFEPFRQANSRVARKYGGTGLGLAIVRQLVELHEGRVTMRSTPDVGSTVSFTLPRRRCIGLAA
jgi:signal transduction histidine kinase